MLQENTEKKLFKTMTWAITFLSLGFLSSPTLVSLYHILFFIPALIIWMKTDQLPISQINKSAWFMLFLSGWGLLGLAYNADDIVKPFKSYQELKFYLFSLLFLPGLTFYYKRASTSQLRKFLNMLSIIVILAFFVGISKAWFSFDPVKMRMGDFHTRSGGFTNYMRYGYASAFLFLMGLGAFLNRHKLSDFISPKLFYPAWVLCFFAIVTSQTRGALLALIVGVPFLLLRYKPKLAKIMIFLGGLFASVVIYCSFINPQFTKIRFLNINQNSNNVRMSQFVSATKAISERPILGFGADQFSYHVKELKQKYDLKHKDYVGHAHNILLEHGANYGIVGMVVLIVFFTMWFKEMLARGDDLGWVIASYIVAFFVSGQVENLFDNTNSHLLFFIYGLGQTFSKNSSLDSLKISEV